MPDATEVRADEADAIRVFLKHNAPKYADLSALNAVVRLVIDLDLARSEVRAMRALAAEQARLRA